MKQNSPQNYTVTPIAHIKSPFRSKFGIPRQSGLLDEIESEIVFEEAFRDPQALRGIEGFSHLWLLWIFSESVTEGFSPTVRPPRLGGNKRVGVFATRAPYRPNSIGLSLVRIVSVEKTSDCGTVLRVAGADLLDGTPIADIKPYIAYTDSRPQAVCGFSDEADKSEERLDVIIPETLRERIDEKDERIIRELLSLDPRPRYQSDPKRIYSFEFSVYHIDFKVDGRELTVANILKNL